MARQTGSAPAPESALDSDALRAFVDQAFDERVVPLLGDYIGIPNKSPAFDPDWHAAGHMYRAASLLLLWAKGQPLRGRQFELFTLPGRTPVVLCEIQGTAPGNVLIYGHYDKQPEFTGWREGLGPWTPVLQDGRLYGRGGADDGYSLPAALVAIEALQAQGIPHPRCLILIEGCEESGSPDLPHYMEALAARIGTPDLVVALDAECGSYDRWWITTSLRGLAIGTLKVGVLSEGVHSGAASGIVPSSFRILRSLLERIEDGATGDVLPALHVDIPAAVREQARDVAETLGEEVLTRYPMLPGLQPVTDDRAELVLNNTWRPALSVTGADGLPLPAAAGNTLHPWTTLKLSMRLPPTLDAHTAGQAIADALQADPPYAATVEYVLGSAETGWYAPHTPDWLARAIDGASNLHFGATPRYMGTGGTIPFMKMLGDRFPQVAFLVTGVLGPHSNAHGPNEFLDIACAAKVTCCVAEVLARLPAALAEGTGDGVSAGAGSPS